MLPSFKIANKFFFIALHNIYYVRIKVFSPGSKLKTCSFNEIRVYKKGSVVKEFQML